MLPLAINHITVPSLSTEALLELAVDLGCIGVELRNDLGRPLFDGRSGETVAAAAKALGLRILGLSQVSSFNAWSDQVRVELEGLIDESQDCGAETISLIPRNHGQGGGDAEQGENARRALEKILPVLDAADLVALVEPLGFETSSLRHKAEAVAMIESLGGAHRLRIVHDTFHQALAGGGAMFPEHTGIVHVSGVVEARLRVPAMRDEHRVLVDANDRLGNVEQLRTLRAAGYAGPISIEAFSPAVHAMPDPATELRRMIEHLERELAAAPVG